MNYDLVKFKIPADFVAARVILTPAELAYGYRHDWIDEAACVHLALAGMHAVPEPSAAYEELALLLSDNLDRVSRLVDEIPADDNDGEIWLYLALARLFEKRSESSDVLAVVEQLYADFGYPSEIESLVRYMPVKEGDDVGEDAIFTRWEEYLDRVVARYRSRS
jgi:hypothetical protein